MSPNYPLIDALQKQGIFLETSQCLPAPEPSALDKMEKEPLDDYLKTLLPEVENYFKKLQKEWYPERARIPYPNPTEDIELIFKVEQGRETENVKYAVIRLDVVILNNNLILEQIDKVLAGGKDVEEETITEVTELKEYLVKYTAMLDAVLLHYTHYCVDLPEFDEVKKLNAKIQKIISQMNPEDLSKILPHEIEYSEEGIICAALGLKSEMAKRLKDVDLKFRKHQPDSYYLKHFLMINMQSANDEEADRELILKKYGFSESRSKILSNWIAENKLSKQQTLGYWVQWYLMYKFQYDIFLSRDCPRYPFHESVTDQWEKVDLEDGNELVHIINTTTKKAHCLTLDGKLFPPMEPQTNLWYHGTLHKSADKIMYNGIKLAIGSKLQDFSDGDGFYLTPDYRYALEWAKCKGPEIALMVFDVGPSLTEFRKMDLSERDKEWEEIVKYNRSGRNTILPIDLKKEFENCSYVTGPMSNVGRTSTTEFVEGNRGNKVMQMCIRSHKMAEAVSSHIYAVIFINDGMAN